MLMSKDEAWKTLPNEKRVLIQDYKQFRIRRNWFHNRNCTTFSTFLLDRLTNDKAYKVLTIGVFEGAQEIWLLQNCLGHADSKLFCIDPWLATSKLDQTFMDECYANAQHNLSHWIGINKTHLNRGFSQNLMSDAIAKNNYCGEMLGTFDLVIIDGDHDRLPVLQDARNAYKFLKPGGWMLFDDVRNNIHKKEHVWDGLEDFLKENDNVQLIWEHRFMSCVEKLR